MERSLNCLRRTCSSVGKCWPKWHPPSVNFRTSTSPKQASSVWQQYWQQVKKYPVPVWAGLLVVGVLQYRRIQRQYKHQDASTELADPFQAKVAKDYEVTLYTALPLELISRLFGKVNQIELPMWARRWLLSWYVNKFTCNMDEAEQCDISAYSSLSELFRRKLKSGVRPIDAKALLTSPCDARVLTCGPVEDEGWIEQVKGLSYRLNEFLGPYNQAAGMEDLYRPKGDSSLFYCTLYLAPGDYHGFHSPADWQIRLRRHFPGRLLSVSPTTARSIPNLFCKNERAVYLGQWDAGFFSMTAIGATNVGSIVIYNDEHLSTNIKAKRRSGQCEELRFAQGTDHSGPLLSKGQPFGEFNLGSTIVLVFEASKNFQFQVQNGQRVLVGQCIGSVRDETD